MADIGQSLAAHFGLPAMDYGTSFLRLRATEEDE
jgi:phosphopentomutase